MNEEIKTILKMVESGKITAEEGEKLITSIDNKNVKTISTPTGKKFLKIEVYSNDEEKTKVKVNIPLNLAKAVLKMESVKNQINVNADGIDIDFNEIISLIESDADGELVNVESDTTKVRIWIE
ncbi:MAG: hypothetical protein K0Q49_1416 [Haloplasmataceae bacterium]|jgi:hypothetical protein|nr:hypothetical protein [Haloplasmataceae bacterium]